MQYWGWFWSLPFIFLPTEILYISCNFNTELSKEIIILYVPFCTLANTTWCLFGWALCIWTTIDTTARTGWGWPGNTWQKDWKLIKWKTLWFGMLQYLLLRSADWSKDNLPWIQTQKIPGESWARSRPLHLGSLSFVNVYLILKLQTALKACISYFYLIYTDFVLSRLTLPGNIF